MCITVKVAGDRLASIAQSGCVTAAKVAKYGNITKFRLAELVYDESNRRISARISGVEVDTYDDPTNDYIGEKLVIEAQ